MASPFAANLEAFVRRYGTSPLGPGASETERARSASASPLEIGVEGGWLKAFLPDGPPPVLCGIGLGRDLALDALLDAVPPCRVILFEPDPDEARHLLSRRPWVAHIDAGQLALLVGPDYAGLAAIARQVPGLGAAPVVVHPRLSAHLDQVGHAREALTRLIFQGDANAAARRALSGRYLLHTLANAPSIARESDAGRLAHTFVGRPAVIAAAGPSLDANLHDLAPVLDRTLVIACDTAAWPLVATGVYPHLVVAVDASEANARHLASLPSGPPGRVWLAAEASVHPSALRPFAGRTFIFKVADHEPWPWLATNGLTRATVDAWGSVATTAFALALDMGCDPIIFIGADFAFTHGRPYCRATTFESIWASWVSSGQSYEEVWRHLLARWPTTYAPDVTGAPTRTAPHLLAFRDWILERAGRRTDRTVVNATGAGVLAGPSIRQQSAGDTLRAAPTLDADWTTRAFRSAHASGLVPGALAAVLASATGLISGTNDPLIERWRTFTDGLVSRDAVRVALTSPEQQAWALGLMAYQALMEAS
jgi:hypothetical protein